MTDRGRFPTAKNLAVDELLRIYDGIMPEVDAALLDANISSQVQIPPVPEGLEEIVVYGPHGDPFPPEDLTAVDPLILGKLFSFLANWANYVQAECTRAKCVLDVEEKKNDIVKSALRMYYTSERQIPVSSVNDYVVTDERFVRCDVAYEKLRAYYKTAESRYEQLKRSLNNTSREQTRRAEELQREIHDTRGGGPRPSFRR